MLPSDKMKRAMPYSRILTAATLLGLAGCELTHSPEGHGPQWIYRPAATLVEKMGAPDRKVHLPLPSLSTVYLYLGGAEPGFAICERDYYIRGETVIGYSEHGVAAGCDRKAGRLE
jgi:hypothetical protein